MTLYAGNTILHEVELTVQNVGWLVGPVFKLQRTALTIFLIFCMELGIDKVNEVTEPDF